MTININKENNNRTPIKGSLQQGGWEETREMHEKLPGTTLTLKTRYASKPQRRA